MATNLTILSYRRDKYVVKEKVVLFGVCEDDERSFYIALDNNRRIVLVYKTCEQCQKALEHFYKMMTGKTSEYSIPIEPKESLIS